MNLIEHYSREHIVIGDKILIKELRYKSPPKNKIKEGDICKVISINKKTNNMLCKSEIGREYCECLSKDKCILVKKDNERLWSCYFKGEKKR